MSMLASLSQLEWRNAWLLLLVLQPLLMWLWARRRRAKAQQYAEPHLLPWAVRGGFAQTSAWRTGATLLAWALLAGAAAGPRLPVQAADSQGKAQAVLHDIDLMIVLDASPSMLATDVAPQRLERAKLKLIDLSKRLHGERLGLIAFSGSAALVMPLNYDYTAFHYYLRFIDTTLFEKPGSNITAALELARRSLVAEGRRSKAIMLLTDADAAALSGPHGVKALEAAKALKHDAIPLYILGLGSEQGAAIPLPQGGEIEHNGAPVISSMDAAGFAELAKTAGGKFARVTDGDGDWQSLYESGLLTLPEKVKHHPPTQVWQELFGWLLLPALLLFLANTFPWRSSAGKSAPLVLAVLFGLFAAGLDVPTAYAADRKADEAFAAYRSGNYLLAQSLYGQMTGYAARMGEGAAAYKRNDHLYAAKQFTAALLAAETSPQRADALFNLGNSYFQGNQFKAAADAYRGVLRYRPDDKPARANLAQAAAGLAAMAKLDTYSAGMLRRRADQRRGDLSQDAGDVAASLEPDVRELGAMLPRKQEPSADQRIEPRSAEQVGTSSLRAYDKDAVHRAALKKLELVVDKPALLYKEMAKLDASDAEGATEAGPPW
jgi:Ca-activated chloride channel family protein